MSGLQDVCFDTLDRADGAAQAAAYAGVDASIVDLPAAHSAIATLAVGSLALGLLFHDTDGRIVSGNDVARHMLAIPADLPMDDWTAILAENGATHTDGRRFGPEQWPIFLALGAWLPARQPTEALGSEGETVLGVRHGDATRWLSISAMALYDIAGKVTGGVTMLRDVTHERETTRRLRVTEATFEHAPQAVMIMDARWRILTANAAFEASAGIDVKNLIGRPAIMLWARHFTHETFKTIRLHIQSKGLWEGELQRSQRGGNANHEWISIRAVYGPSNEIESYVVMLSNVSERKLAEERIHFLANYDPLTQLPNRSMLARLMAFAIADAKRKKSILAVMFLDLDNFKWVNDSLGHHMGDQLLVHVARHIRETVRESDVIARQGGDEFIVGLRGLDSGHEAASVAQKLIETLSRPIAIEEHKLNVGVSIGIAVFPNDGLTMDDLLKNADAAMYEAKRAGRGQYAYYSPDLNAQAIAYASTATRLRGALGSEMFEMHYQPLVDAMTGKPVCFEALIRSRDSELGGPATFIPVAERTGLIIELGEWIMVAACRQVRRWLDMGFDPPPIAVNVSASQLRNRDLIRTVTEAAVFARIPHRYIEVELTETSLMDRLEDATEVLSWLRSHGIRTAIDDFGTGYSSLAYLQRLPIDRLKIDRTFVSNMEFDTEGNVSNDTVARAIIGLAKSLSLEVVAEGVETAHQAAALAYLGCDYLQGYYFGRPAPAAKLPELYEWVQVAPAEG